MLDTIKDTKGVKGNDDGIYDFVERFWKLASSKTFDAIFSPLLFGHIAEETRMANQISIVGFWTIDWLVFEQEKGLI